MSVRWLVLPQVFNTEATENHEEPPRGLRDKSLDSVFQEPGKEIERSYSNLCCYCPNPMAPMIEVSRDDLIERASIIRRQLR